MFGQNSEHRSMSDIASNELEKIWECNVDAGFGGFSLTAGDGIVFIATLKGDIHSINARDGDKNGSKSFGGAIFSGPIIYDSSMIVASSQSKNNLFAYQLASGKIIWSKDIDDVESAPALFKKTLYVATVDGNLYKIDVTSGEELFHEKFSICAMGSSDGQQIWKYDTGTSIWCSASLNDSLIFIGTNGGKLLVLTRKGKLRFDFTTGEKILSMPIADDKKIYFGCNNGNFYAINIGNGSLAWRIQTDAPIIAAAAQTRTQIIFGGLDGNLYVVSKSDGKVVQKIKLSGRIETQPAIYKNYLFIGAEDENIYGFLIK